MNISKYKSVQCEFLLLIIMLGLNLIKQRICIHYQIEISTKLANGRESINLYKYFYDFTVSYIYLINAIIFIRL